MAIDTETGWNQIGNQSTARSREELMRIVCAAHRLRGVAGEIGDAADKGGELVLITKGLQRDGAHDWRDRPDNRRDGMHIQVEYASERFHVWVAQDGAGNLQPVGAKKISSKQTF